MEHQILSTIHYKEEFYRHMCDKINEYILIIYVNMQYLFHFYL